MIDTSEALRPNTFLIGAPKSGAIALTQYLRDHPYVFFPTNPKPHFWASDLGGLRKHAGIIKTADYLALYANAGDKHRVLGDGSTAYLTSESAVPQILEFDADAKFVVLLRNPVDLLASFHRQLLQDGHEDQEDFEAAWSLQRTRREGDAIPSGSIEHKLLRYREVGLLGKQFDRASQAISDARLQTHFFEDFNKRPSRVYRSVVSFLELPDDNRREFPLNTTQRPKPKLVRGLMRTPLARRFYTSVKTKLSAPIVTTVRDSVLVRPPDETAIRPIFRNKLIDEFEDDIRLLADRTGRCLDHWLQRQPTR